MQYSGWQSGKLAATVRRDLERSFRGLCSAVEVLPPNQWLAASGLQRTVPFLYRGDLFKGTEPL